LTYIVQLSIEAFDTFRLVGGDVTAYHYGEERLGVSNRCHLYGGRHQKS